MYFKLLVSKPIVISFELAIQQFTEYHFYNLNPKPKLFIIQSLRNFKNISKITLDCWNTCMRYLSVLSAWSFPPDLSYSAACPFWDGWLKSINWMFPAQDTKTIYQYVIPVENNKGCEIFVICALFNMTIVHHKYIYAYFLKMSGKIEYWWVRLTN